MGLKVNPPSSEGVKRTLNNTQHATKAHSPPWSRNKILAATQYI